MIRTLLPYLTSVVTLFAVWLSAKNLRLSWKVSLGNQGLWLLFIVTFGAWGLLPLCGALTGLFARNLWRTR